MLRIINGEVYDPANNINGEVREICLESGRIVQSVNGGKTIDASGMAVMPGGIDMHSHIAGSKVSVARRFQPEPYCVNHCRMVPTSYATGQLYSAMGYTTVFDAAIPPMTALHAHNELSEIPFIDKGFFVLMGNNEFILRQLAARELEKSRHFAAWLLNASKGYAIKIVNPGGGNLWKTRGNAHSLDDEIQSTITPRRIIQSLARTSMDLDLPHPLHIHCNNLGIAGNWQTTFETMKSLEGMRGHFAHIQFHSYGGDPGDMFTSRVGDLVQYVNAHSNVTVDVGQIMFGKTVSITGDGRVAHMLSQVDGRKWINFEMENEEGCGIVPIDYKDKNFVHATQWAIGLEWFLLMHDPWRIALSTDHPNGASFVSYPKIIRLLMDRDYRREALKKVNPKAIAKTSLPDNDREYSLYEIAIITRAAPARILGLQNKGHLGIGADADVAIYEKNANKEKMFEAPRYVIKGGEVIIEDGQFRREVFGKTLYVAPAYDRAIEKDVREFFKKYYTIEFENYAMQADHCLPNLQEIAAIGK